MQRLRAGRFAIAALVLVGVAAASIAAIRRGPDEPAARTRTTGAQGASASLTDLPLAPPRTTASRSALTNAPGYTPPADPESLSVARGRREVGPIDEELLFAKASPEELGREILAAINAEDERVLKRLRLSKEEYARIVWPELPASRPITNISVDEAWSNYLFESDEGMYRAVTDNAGKSLALERISFSVGVRPYTNFKVYAGANLHARTGAGTDTVLDFAAAFIERNGRWKVFSYQD
ncbi:MAG: hypothetical protein ACKVU1_14410 [bacterium]